MKSKVPDKAFTMIIGSMRCGTSSFYKYLIDHPEICPARVKEPEFFSENQSHKLECVHYQDLWSFDKEKHKIALEASTGYTKYPLEPRVPENIYEYGIIPRLIYCVRNPFDKIVSQYQFVKNNPNWVNHEIVSSFTINFSNYYLQLERFREFFPKKNILIIDFNDIKLNPVKALNQVYSFLNLSKDYYPKVFPVLNKTWNDNPPPERIKILTQLEKKSIFNALESDMKKFKSEYGFYTEKWGF